MPTRTWWLVEKGRYTLIMEAVHISFLTGLALLVGGAEALVRGASRLASRLGVPQLVIGLTIVAYGTSSPELAVSVHSSLMGQSSIAVGNVIGSNIFNVLFILGTSAALCPLVVSNQLVKLDVPIMIGAAVMALLFGLDGRISRWEAGVLFAGGLAYTIILVKLARKAKISNGAAVESVADKAPHGRLSWVMDLLLIVVGLGLLVQGSRWLVDGAVHIARALSISELVIGLTVVAAGTSLPELATSVVASLRGERDIAVGNVVGSNIFNVLAVLGLCGLVSADGVEVSEAASHFDLPFMIAVSVACLPIFFTGNRISRWEGILFLAYYGAYTCYLVLYSTQHEMLPLFNKVMLVYVAPLTALTLLVLFYRTLRSGRAR